MMKNFINIDPDFIENNTPEDIAIYLQNIHQEDMSNLNDEEILNHYLGHDLTKFIINHYDSLVAYS